MTSTKVIEHQKGTEIVGPRLPLCSQIFLPANVNANPRNISVHLQLIWLHNAYQFIVSLSLSPFGRNLNGEFWDPKFWGLGSVSGLGFAPIEIPPTTSQYLLIQSFALSAAVWQQFQCQVMTSNSTPYLGGRVDLRGRKWYRPKFRPNIPIRLLNASLAYFAPFGHNTQRDRQTIGRLC